MESFSLFSSQGAKDQLSFSTRLHFRIMSIRRVSFSDRISYSDEASTTTVSTDDELFRDDGSFVTSDDEDSEADEKQGDPDPAANTKGPDKKIEGKNEANGSVADRDYRDDDADVKVVDEDPSEPWYTPVKDEPPLVFRDIGVVERPSEYLGGYGSSEQPHRVKLRKSWVADEKSSEELQSAYQEFEAWKQERAKVAAKKQAEKASKKKKETKEHEQACDDYLEVSHPGPTETDLKGSFENCEEEKVCDMASVEPVPVADPARSVESDVRVDEVAGQSTKKPKSALKKPKFDCSESNVEGDGESQPKKEAKARKCSKTLQVRPSKMRDLEMEAHE